MASWINLVMVLVSVGSVLTGTKGETTHVVGDNMGWEIPPSGSIAYSNWASNQTFQVGDTLVFNWTGIHTVAEVSKEDYDNCTTTTPIGSLQTISPATINIDSAGVHYYICTIPTHCALGQKVSVSTGAASSLTFGPYLSTIFITLAVSLLSYV
ncbi:Phytocyanin domain, partial [Dillenia turbinata]